MSKKKRNAIAAAAVVVTLVAVGFIVENHLDHLEDLRNKEVYAKLLPLVETPPDADFYQTVDAVRKFINQNTVHDMDEEFYAHWKKHDVIAKKIFQHAQDNNAVPVPHLECSSRSFVMEAMLQKLGYRTRSIDVYKPAPDYPAHTFLDVQNPKTGKWHIQDPDYDIFWTEVDTGKRISSIELVKSSLEDVVPCISEDECGWDIQSRESIKANTLKNYAGLAVIKDYVIDQRDLFTNAERFSLANPHLVANQGSLTYCEHIDKNCKGKITVFK